MADEEKFGEEVSKKPKSATSTMWDWIKGHADPIGPKPAKDQPTQKTARDKYGIGTGAIYD
jgi:hypothetical protein